MKPSKYSVMQEIAKALRGNRPTGAGAKRDKKLQDAEKKALGMDKKSKGDK